MNKILKELGLDTVNAGELNALASKFEDDDHLYNLVLRAIDGELDLTNLKHYYDDEDSTYEEKSNPSQNLHKVLSPTNVDHQRTLSNNREFNKAQRNGAFHKMLMDDLKEDIRKEVIDKIGTSSFKSDYFHVDDSNAESALIVTMADFHIGAVVDVKNGYGYGYNFEILGKRLEVYRDNIAKLIHELNPDYVFVAGLGDFAENTNMRGAQSFDVEFNFSKQIAKATKVVYDMLKFISDLKPVRFGTVNGNHGRFATNKKEAIYAESAEGVILETLMTFQSEGLLPNVEIIDNVDTISSFDTHVVGYNIHVEHGDHIKGKNPIANIIDDKPIDLLLTGHYHSLSLNQESKDRLHLTTGSIMGSNTYSLENHFGNTKPSQSIIYLKESLDGPILYPVFFEKEN